MRIEFKKREPDKIEFGIVYGGIAALCLLAARFLPIAHFLPACVFKGISGIPCPTCGTTRAVSFFARGDFVDSLAMNPLVALLLAASGIYFLYSSVSLLFSMQRISLSLTEREKDDMRITAVMTLLANWGYVIYTL